jgi:succinate dehydrogenase/fumarate reductase cytochrome b subunit
MNSSSDHRGSGLLLVLLTCAYLLFELAFNARLLDVAGGKPDKQALDHIELLGRLLSGVGLSLVLWRWMAHAGAGVLTSLSRLIGIGIVIVPSVYFGQKLLIDEIVDSASTKQRATAALSSQIPVALLWDAVTLKGLELSTQVWSTAEGKTFLAVLPLLAYNSPDLIESVEKQLRPLVTRVVQERVGTPGENYNQYYLPVANEIRGHWNKDYRAASLAIANATAQHGTADDLWRDYMIEIGQQPFTDESATTAQRAAVIKRLRQRGVNVPDHWQLYDRVGFEAALPSCVFRRS